MPYRVSIESFEGPFELLLSLVSEQKLDIGRISVTEVADQYLAYVDSLRDLDMEVASDFLVVASTLLSLKAEALLPDAVGEAADEFDAYTPEQARDILVNRLIAYKQFKSVAGALNSRLEGEGRMHPRQVGLESDFIGLLPDYLEGVTLHSLAVICADLAARREVFLLEAEHIVSRPLAIEKVIDLMMARLQAERSLSFSQMLRGQAYPRLVVVSFLGLLELYHRGVIDIEQADALGEIEISYRDVDDWTPANVTPSAPEPIDEYLKTLEAGDIVAPDEVMGLDNLKER
jgi:segregation and condensation protein A